MPALASDVLRTMVVCAAVVAWGGLATPGWSAPPLTTAGAPRPQHMAQQPPQGVHQQLLQLTVENERLRQRLQTDAEQQGQRMGRLKTLHEQVTQHLQEAVAQQLVTVRLETERVVLELRGEALFAPRGGGLPPQLLPTLDKIVAFVKPLRDYQVLVEGHTETATLSPAVQKRWGNHWEWSASRAATLARYLETKGLPATQLAVIGYGASRPLASHDTEDGRAKNQRLEIVLQPAPSAR